MLLPLKSSRKEGDQLKFLQYNENPKKGGIEKIAIFSKMIWVFLWSKTRILRLTPLKMHQNEGFF